MNDAPKEKLAFTPEYYMRLALREARKAYDTGEVPVGAVIVWQQKVIARAHNQVELLKDGTAHAEMIALTQAAAAVGDWRLTECCLYVSKEPCAMCAGAMVNCRLGKLVFGCNDPRMGAAGSALNITAFPGMLHRVETESGVLEEECSALLREFFQTRRIKRPEPQA
ncbi:MAG: tRNA adenosine(34) deaminase TadA [Lentisphaerae bacterium]|jgi:tRNA(adenine34) deaminase|nr:tRNA adenosine(34) deaminase TadA [Lentisphaerota bacterium]